jgi:hypothetical protein
MTVIDRPWLFKDDDGLPRFRGAAWYGDAIPVASAYWPGPRAKKEFEPHDAQTRSLMRTVDELYRLLEGNAVVPMLEETGSGVTEWRRRPRSSDTWNQSFSALAAPPGSTGEN